MITMSEQVVPSAVAQRIIVKFITNENVKPDRILTRLTAQFGDETVSRAQAYNWRKSFKVKGRTEVKNTRRLKLLHGKIWPVFFCNSHGVLFINFLTEQQTTNAAYYSKLLNDRVKPALRSKRRSRSVKSVCLLHDHARPHTAAVTTGTLEEMHWEVLLHPTYSLGLVRSDFHLFGPLKVALGGKIFRADDKVKLLVQR
jgi:hypothetical protein